MLSIFLIGASIMQPATKLSTGGGRPQGLLASVVGAAALGEACMASPAGLFPSIMPVVTGPGELRQSTVQTTLEGERGRFAVEAPMWSTWFHDFMMGGSGAGTATSPSIFDQGWVDELIDAIGKDSRCIPVRFQCVSVVFQCVSSAFLFSDYTVWALAHIPYIVYYSP